MHHVSRWYLSLALLPPSACLCFYLPTLFIRLCCLPVCGPTLPKYQPACCYYNQPAWAGINNCACSDLVRDLWLWHDEECHALCVGQSPEWVGKGSNVKKSIDVQNFPQNYLRDHFQSSSCACVDGHVLVLREVGGGWEVWQDLTLCVLYEPKQCTSCSLLKKHE